MKNKFWISLFTAMVLVSCKTPMNIANVQPQKNISIGSEIPTDTATENIIAPYKTSMEKQMNEKISYTDTDLTKIGDNSNLGNLLADYTLQGARQWAKDNQIHEVQAAV
ncbi:MAG: bifunctional NAD pyrophosphatase/5'-nucleotidase, partial [Cruoricaptor ignavus]|nr:bifunctional NAD pyrophosphatase/5'-nucleotidase [Cruoricaptor ignavus]